MSVHSFLKSALSRSLTTMGAESIVIGSTTIQATAGEVTSSNALGIGATNNERNLIVKFPATAYTGTLKSGMTVTARGQSWQISSESGSIRKGQIATTITLVEPERRDE